MSELDDFDAAMSSIEGVAEKLAADDRSVKAAGLVEDCRFMAIGERSPARAFFSQLALGLDPVPSREVPTMGTDGKRMIFNPEFVLGLTQAECYAVAMAHEPLHCGNQHFIRDAGMDDKDLANIAGDLEINQIIREAGYTLPKTALFPGEGPYKDCPVGLFKRDSSFLTKLVRNRISRGKIQI